MSAALRRLPARTAQGLRGALASVMAALSWVVLGLLSLATCLAATWIALALAGDAALGAGASWAMAVFLVLGAPFFMAVWKHGARPREIRESMVWLPILWNTSGLAVAALLVPDLLGRALRTQGARLAVERLGHSRTTTRVLSALGHTAADLVDPAHADPAASERRSPARHARGPTRPISAEPPIRLPFGEEGTAIRVNVTLEGKKETVTLPYLFDTGASFTTLSSRTAQNLGIDVPADAPTLRFNTASGPRESRMVFLPALHLGGVRIPGLLVSVCDACVNDRTDGLLGLNVIREFLLEMDYQGEEMLLYPRIDAGRPDRRYDIEPVVDLAVEGSHEIWLGRVHWVVLVHNRGTESIEHVIPELRFDDGSVLRGTPVARIEPGEIGRSLVEGRAAEGRGAGRLGFTLWLAEAYW